MRITDEIILNVCSGSGGDGLVAYSAHKARGGKPSGGDGGNGGDVYIVAVDDIFTLNKYKGNPNFNAEDGGPGQRNWKKGKKGKDLEIQLPVGSIVHVEATGASYELLKVGDRIKILSGGRGGHGNAYFKSSTNRSPNKAVKGQKGICSTVRVELNLIADIGLVGLPSAGKSSLFNALTGARSKTGQYPFTTLNPHLGPISKFTIADIPGIIEGAHSGKGLGDQFLKHIKRSKALIYCISVERDNPYEEFLMLQKELKEFDATLLDKKYIVALTKKDLAEESEIESKKARFKAEQTPVYPVSIYDEKSVRTLASAIESMLESLDN